MSAPTGSRISHLVVQDVVEKRKNLWIPLDKLSQEVKVCLQVAAALAVEHTLDEVPQEAAPREKNLRLRVRAPANARHNCQLLPPWSFGCFNGQLCGGLYLM